MVAMMAEPANRAPDRGEGPSNGGGGGGLISTVGVSSSTLAETMRAPPNTNVVVIGAMPDDWLKKEVLDPKQDLWLSTYDGRYNSALIPIRVGLGDDAETFTVHKRVLEKVAFFRTALSGPYRESETQSLSLPEEQPAVFHHLVTFLYEGKYEPIKPIASELIPDLDKGKGREGAAEGGDDSMSDSDAGSLPSDSTVRSRRVRERQRRREDRAYERLRRKHPGTHRPGCVCPQCMAAGTPCWNCGMSRLPPPPIPMPGPYVDPYMPGNAALNRNRSRRRLGEGQAAGRRRAPPHGPVMPAPPPLPGLSDPYADRIKGEDMRTWLMAYELNIDVYICAHRFMMDDFKRAVERSCIDMLETAGSDAAQPRVLQLCRRLCDGLGSETDPLLKMVLARMGFLQPAFARAHPEETHDFFVTNPDLAMLIVRETASRRDEEGRNLPSMEVLSNRPPFDGPYYGHPPRGGHRHHPHAQPRGIYPY